MAQAEPSLPETPIRLVKIGDAMKHVGETVRIRGWVVVTRKQGKKIVFVILRGMIDATQCISPKIQCVICDQLTKRIDLSEIRQEAFVEFVGELKADERPAKSDVHKLPPIEVTVHDFKIVGSSDPDFDQIVREDSSTDIKLDERHLVHRSSRETTIMYIRSRFLMMTRLYMDELGAMEVTPPTLVQSQCEGGSTLFKLKYYDAEAYMTQSSQLYLETLPHYGKVFCVSPSYRAEKSHTCRHLAEYTHFEVELFDIDFKDLMKFTEQMIMHFCQEMMRKYGKQIHEIHPGFKMPTKFVYMSYADAIKFLEDKKIFKDSGEPYKYGEDIPEKPERTMVDMIGEFVFIHSFPTSLKDCFYMKLREDDPSLTESFDLLFPGVGEIIGSSTRVTDYDELIARMKEHKLPIEKYKWYTDQRKYGSVPHGGFGLGVERFLMWLLGLDSVMEACLYPRRMGRLTP